MRTTYLSFILLGCMTLPAQSAHAAHSVAERMAIFAKQPNWTGIWTPVAANGSSPEPAFTASWIKKHHNPKTASTTDNAASRCVWGMPRLLNTNHEFEVIVTPEQTFFSYDINEFRHVWTDGRKHPLHLTNANTGYSIGHWEGQTLVIDTTGMESGLWINRKGATLSSKATLQERWTQTDNDHLKVDATIIDPAALARPFVFTRRFQRDDDNNRLSQQQCFDEDHGGAFHDS